MKPTRVQEHDPEYDAEVGSWLVSHIWHHLVAGGAAGLILGLLS